MDVRTYDEFPHGFSWVIDEGPQRASHALTDGSRVWLVDPVDVPEALERARGLGTPAAVIQLLDRHNRDCAAVAERLGVPHLTLPETVPDSPLQTFSVLDVPGWHERALWWPEHRLLVVAEAVGTVPFFAFGEDPVGVHPVLRLTPPKALRGYQPQHLLVGHGAGVHGAGASSALREALAHSRSDVPKLLAKIPGALRR
jgi:hypothetical protein